MQIEDETQESQPIYARFKDTTKRRFPLQRNKIIDSYFELLIVINAFFRVYKGKKTRQRASLLLPIAFELRHGSSLTGHYRPLAGCLAAWTRH